MQKKSPHTRKPNGEKKVQELQKIKKQKIQETEELVEKLSGKISKNKIRSALKYYTRNMMYHQAVLINTYRIDLAGKRCELITSQQKEYSQKCLGDILAKAQQRYKQ